MNYLYLFLDEAGNFDFSRNGTKYLVFSCCSVDTPEELLLNVSQLKHYYINLGFDLEYFHASEDKQFVRNGMFDLIKNSQRLIIDSVVIQKNKTNPSIREFSCIYKRIYLCLLKYILSRNVVKSFDIINIFFDQVPTNRKRDAVIKAVKEAIKELCPPKQKYSIFFHQSKSHPYLQISDYCCWAIYKKWNDSDMRSYSFVQGHIKSEFDYFQLGNTCYY